MAEKWSLWDMVADGRRIVLIAVTVAERRRGMAEMRYWIGEGEGICFAFPKQRVFHAQRLGYFPWAGC